MSRNWSGLLLLIGAGLALFAAAVQYSIHHRPAPKGFSGLEFAPLTRAASARTPLLATGGALVINVMEDSPAARAKIKPGEVVSAIDGSPIHSAGQASDIVSAHKAGEHVTLTLYDITQGEIHPRRVTLIFDAIPVSTRSFSVRPPQTLAKEYFYPPRAAANAAWSRRILLGPTIKPLELSALAQGRCDGFAPEAWRIAGHSADNSLFHVMAKEGFAHAIYRSAMLKGARAPNYVLRYLQDTFAAETTLSLPRRRPFGFTLVDFGNVKGGVGFVLYRVVNRRISMWIAAVAGSDAAWAEPLVGAVALSLHCASPGAPGPRPRDRQLLATRISTRCIHGRCEETDFAATFLTVLHKGYVHNAKGAMFLISPRRDYWVDGAEGPGFYHQIGGENEKLLPGRTN